MLAPNKKTSLHFNAYYYDNSILIQLVITEFITTYETICQIQGLIEEGLESVDTLDKVAKQLAILLQNLLGISTFDHSNCRWIKGSLTKLKNYCEQFSRNKEHRDENSVDLYTVVHQAWLGALHDLELLRPFFHIDNLSMSHSIFLRLKQSLNQIDNRLNEIHKPLTRLIIPFQADENVMFFLLRKKEALSKIYGPNFMAKFFKENVKSQPDLLQVLIKRYEHRGFEHLVHTVDS